MSMYNINNGIISVEIDSFGAELKSVKLKGQEFIWQGDKKFWTSSAPILFPICGGLKNDIYCFEGKEYSLPKHGFARKKEFILYNQEKDKLIFLLKSDKETLAVYPFKFDLLVKYSLLNNSLKIEYNVVNLSGKTMYYSIGAHEAYSCLDGIEEFSVVFEKREDLLSNKLNGNLVSDEKNIIGVNSNTIKLNYGYFAVDALVFKNLKSRKAVLTNGKRKITLEYSGFPYFLIWTKPNAPYICLEPWKGIPDSENATGNLIDKEGIISIKKDENSVSYHCITFEL